MARQRGRAAGVAICLVSASGAADAQAALTVTTNVPAGTINVVGDSAADFVSVTCNGASGGGTEVSILSAAPPQPTGLSCGALTSMTVTGNGGGDTLSLGALSSQFPALTGVSVDGGAGADVITGTEGADTIVAGTENDTVSPVTGNDSLDGGAGADQLTLSSGGTGRTVVLTNTAVTGSGGVASHTGFEAAAILGTAGTDSLSSLDWTNGPVTLSGSSGANAYRIGAGLTTVTGSASGDDTLTADFATGSVANVGATTLLRAGSDVTYSELDQINLLPSGAAPLNVIGGAATARISVVGGAAADVLSGGTAEDTLIGGGGNDTLRGGGRSDRLSSGGNDDSVDGGAGTDVLAEAVDRVSLSDTRLTGDVANVTLAGVEQADLTAAGPVLDVELSRFSGPVTSTGGAGNDSVVGSAGADVFAGGGGTDAYAARTETSAGLLSDTVVLSGGTTVDLLASVEQAVLVAGAGGATLFASPGVTLPMTLTGGSGPDTLRSAVPGARVNGSTGDDLLQVSAPAATILGGPGTDTVQADIDGAAALLRPASLTLDGVASPLTDVEAGRLIATTPVGTRLDAAGFPGPVTLTGAAGEDTLTGGAAADALDGAGGSDLLALTGPSAVLGAATAADGTSTDTLVSVERGLLAGTGGPDALSAAGFPGPVELDGGDGADSLTGGSGPDTVTGGGGVDQLLGGPGADDVRARDGLADGIDCGADADLLTADAGEDGAGCETVDRPPVPPPPPPPPAPVTVTQTVTTPGPTTTVTAPPPPPAAPPAVRRAEVVSARFDARRRLLVTIRCPAPRRGTCTGTLTLTAKAGARTITLGRKAYRVLLGRSTTVTFPVSAVTRKRVVKAGRFRFSASVGGTTAKALNLRAPK